jgi:hypothetical protein
MERNKISVIEKQVFLSKKEKFSVRLIINYLPQNVISKRLAKAKKEQQKRNKRKKFGTLTAEYIARAHFNLIITNATRLQIKASSAYNIYSVRWQIELVFKAWKSICDIEKAYKKVKRERIESYIYGKLLFIVLGWQMFWSLCKILYQTDGLLISIYKFFKTWMKKVSVISCVLHEENNNTLEFVSSLYERSKIYHLLETRKKDNTCFELLLDITGCLKLGQKQYE